MANLWQECICDADISCSVRDYADAQEALDVSRYAEEPRDQGFELRYDKERLVMLAEEMGSPEDLDDAFLNVLGRIITKAGVAYWGFSWANRSSRLIIGESGGGRFRIYPDGSIVFAREVWEDNQGMARVAWTAEDVRTLAPQLSEEQAWDWLGRHASQIQELLVERGWGVLEDMLGYDGIEISEGDEDEDDDDV